ncbi:response regulator transcription factor [Gallicola sp. Sow4_E12]|uniref:response regulator transcription factor n=1 Tax=Gallicola sp. Sow4_E12 TaxID=3438785 RepID=UPI003F91035F
MSLKILLAFPESSYREEIVYNFSSDVNYEINNCSTIEDALKFIQKEEYDIVLMDMIFKDGTGLDLKKKMNDIIDIPTIFVTEINDDIQKVLALEYGADDYIVYPFNILELKARIRAVLRRVAKNEDKNSVDKDNEIVINNFKFSIVGRMVTLDDEEIDLTGKEFDILYILVSNPGKVTSREDIAKEIWGENYEGHLRTVDVHIKRLREKIDDKESTLIRTKWGEGYYFGNEE